MAAVARRDDLRRIEQSLTRLARISSGREAARVRAERSGVDLSRPSLSILLSLRTSGPVRLTDVSRITGLEPPLISREVRDLVAAGYVRRRSDPTDGRAGIVELSAKGRRTAETYRSAIDGIIAETFSDWTPVELSGLAATLDRLVGALARRPRAEAG